MNLSKHKVENYSVKNQIFHYKRKIFNTFTYTVKQNTKQKELRICSLRLTVSVNNRCLSYLYNLYGYLNQIRFH